MVKMQDVVELINDMETDKSIPKNVRVVLEDIKTLLADNSRELGLRVDSAMQMIENVSLDPNLSPYIRTQVWNLTSLLENVSE